MKQYCNAIKINGKWLVADFRCILGILVHKSSKTTEVFTHVSKSSIGKTISPLDRLEE
ncbi:hypothetical protein KAT89_03245 [candidate division WOR-3 bacterium]|nr:hypothetical protein [candidate division WOR-3 bacterium]